MRDKKIDSLTTMETAGAGEAGEKEHELEQRLAEVRAKKDLL